MHKSLYGNSCALLERIKRAAMDFGRKRAITNENGMSVSYAKLWESATEVRKGLLGPTFRRRAVAINVSDPLQFTTSLLAVWMNDSIAVPLRNENKIFKVILLSACLFRSFLSSK
jgi:acyl-CoA synthetase (AMP-forming)/AMP-acid ligase II